MNALLEFYESMFEQEYITKENKMITERAVLICPNPKETFSIHANPDNSFNLGESHGYFKWINHEKFMNGDKIARIKYGSPEYVYHKDPYGKNTVMLNNTQKKLLIKLLQSPLTSKQLDEIGSKFSGIIDNGWKLLIYHYNIQCGFNENEILKYANAKKEDIPLNLIRLCLPMPNYLLLPNKKK